MDGCGYPSTSNIIQFHPSTSIHIQVFYITAQDQCFAVALPHEMHLCFVLSSFNILSSIR